MPGNVVETPNGGRMVVVTIKHRLTHYDLVAAVLTAHQKGETKLDRKTCVRYAKSMLREEGVDGLIEAYNGAEKVDRNRAKDVVGILFPEMTAPLNTNLLRLAVM